ncbi:MAG: signal peptidase I [Patescibacteria group bacterium]
MGIFAKSKINTADSWLVKVFGAALGGALVYVFEVLKVVITAGLIIVLVRYYLIQPFYVRGASMEPTFENREYLLIDEITYRFREPKRGEVVVFRHPQNTVEFFIKRIIGLPGETVTIENGKVTVANDGRPDGVVLEESYIGQVFTEGHEQILLNKDEYFVLGDNRSASMDSRIIGPVKREYFVGRVLVRGLPLSKFSIFESPLYPFTL